MISRRWFYILLILLVLLLVNKGLGIYTLGGWFKHSEIGSTICVMTFNINATGNNKQNEEYRKQIISLIRNTNPDILCIQELNTTDFLKNYSELDSFYVIPIQDRKKSILRYNLLSRKPIRNFVHHKCEDDIDISDLDSLEIHEFEKLKESMPVFSAEIEVEANKWVTVFSGHLRSSAYSTARRSMDEDSNWFDGFSLYWRNYKVGKRI